jgi:arginyl-tRNA synthetase
MIAIMANQKIGSVIEAAVKECFDVSVPVELVAAEALHGDLSCNVAFRLAAQLKKPPTEIAAQLAGVIRHDDIKIVQAAGGYINITLTNEYWIGQLEAIGEKFGKNQSGSGLKLQVEFISANPTGPLTLGNARGGFIGDVLARVLKENGYDVVREYYFNDAGSQIAKLVESVKAAAGLVYPAEIQYRGEYIEELAAEFEAELKTDSDEKLGSLLTQAIFERFLRPAISRMGIEFDVWFNERGLVESGKTEEALGRLRSEGLLYEKDGAVWLAVSELDPIERDRVMVKSNQTADLTYLVNDIPYHINIFGERGFDKAIKVLGADHHGQVPALVLTIHHLFPDKQLDVLLYQFVRLIKDGQEVKMSKRAGTYVTTDELMTEVGADVARFFFLMRSADTHMDFDLSLAKEQSQKNPYWYVMYAYVRACSVLQQAEIKGLLPKAGLTHLAGPERALAKKMSQWPELIKQIGDDYSVHRLTFFGAELAGLFHDYYDTEKIISLPEKAACQKLWIIQQFRIFMRGYWKILGIEPIEKM